MHRVGVTAENTHTEPDLISNHTHPSDLYRLRYANTHLSLWKQHTLAGTEATVGPALIGWPVQLWPPTHAFNMGAEEEEEEEAQTYN